LQNQALVYFLNEVSEIENIETLVKNMPRKDIKAVIYETITIMRLIEQGESISDFISDKFNTKTLYKGFTEALRILDEIYPNVVTEVENNILKDIIKESINEF